MVNKAGVIGVKILLEEKEAIKRVAKFEASIRAMAKSVTLESRRISKELESIKAPKVAPVVKGAKDTTKALKDTEKQARATSVSLAKLGAAYFAVSRGVRAAVSTSQRGAEFSLRLAEIATLSDEATFAAEEQARIVNTLSDLYGESVLVTAPALYDAISAGATDAASSLALMERGLGLSIATVSSQKQAVSLLSGVLNSYGDAVGGAAEVSDDFFAIVQQGKLVLSDLDPALGRVTPLAKSAGLSFKELGASIVALTRSGSSASESITKIRSIINASIKKADDFDASFQRLGLRFDSNTIKSLGFLKTLQLLSDSVGGSREELGKLIGRVEGLTGLLSIVDDDARLYTEAMEGMANSTGLVDQAVGELRSSVGREFKEIENAVDNMAVRFGDRMATLIVAMKEAVTLTETLRQEQAKLERELAPSTGPSGRAISQAAGAVLTSPVDIGTFAAGSFEPDPDTARKIDEVARALDALFVAQNQLGDAGRFFEPFVIGSEEAAEAVIKLKDIGGELDDLVIPIPFEVSEAGLQVDFVKSIERLIRSSDFTQAGLRSAIKDSVIDPVVGELENGLFIALSDIDTVNLDGEKLLGIITREVSAADARSLSSAFKAKVDEAVANAAEDTSGQRFNVNAFLDVEGLVSGLGDIQKAFREVNIEMGLGITAQQFNTEFTRQQIEAVTQLRKSNLDVLATAEERLRAGKRALELQLKGVVGLDNESRKQREILKIRIAAFRDVIPLAARLNNLEKDRLNNIERNADEAERRDKELLRLRKEFASVARVVADAERAAVEQIDLETTRDLERAKLRVVQLNAEISGGIEGQTAILQANRAAEIASINAKVAGNEELGRIYEEQKRLLVELSDLEVDKARFNERKRLLGLETEILALRQRAADSRGVTSGAAQVAAVQAIVNVEQEIDLLEKTQPLRKSEIALLEEKKALLIEVGEQQVRNAQFEAGELGFFDSFSESIRRATEDMNSFGELGRSVGEGFASLGVQWAQSLDEGGNAWDKFEDIVLKGIADILIQWGVLGALSTTFNLGGGGGLSNAAKDLGAASVPLILAGNSLDGAATKLITGATLLLAANASGGGGASFGSVLGAFADGGVMKGNMGIPFKAYAGGGIANEPQLALFGEGPSKAEAFVPLPDGRSIPVSLNMGREIESAIRSQAVFSDLARSRQAHLGAPGIGGGGGLTVQVDARGSNDPASVEMAVSRGIQEAMPSIERHIGASMQSGRSRSLVDGVRQAAKR